MKKYFLSYISSTLLLLSNSLVHPLDFKGSEKEKEHVIQYISEHVKEQYTKIGMGSESMLRMMEKNELSSFKYLTSVKDRKLLDSVISKYCSIGMCSYNTIKMMYNNELKASKEKLSW
jgi:ribosome-binding ATPase YchF (GTP1/OBG family)